MAKTRSQTRIQAQTQAKVTTRSLKQKLKKNTTLKQCDTNLKKKIQSFPVMKECFIRLDRIDLTRVDSLNVRKKYNLRKSLHCKTEEKKEMPPKPLKTSVGLTVALSQSALYTSRAARLWEKKKKEISSNVSLQIDDVVCSRMAGHRPWPAKIVEFKRNGTLLRFLKAVKEVSCINCDV